MDDTSGFYKLDGIVLYGREAVESLEFSLYRDQKDSYSYPVYGWYWFDTEDEAYTFFNVEKPKPQEMVVPNFMPPML